MPAGQCNWDLGGVGTAGARKQEALRHACDVAGDHYLVGELGDLAAAGGTDVARPAHRLPHPVALGAVEIGPLAAGHDRKRALGGAEAAARDRGIEMANPALLEPGGVLLRHLRWDRGHVDEYGIALHRIRGAAVEEHLADNRPAIEDGQDIVGALHAVGWISGYWPSLASRVERVRSQSAGLVRGCMRLATIYALMMPVPRDAVWLRSVGPPD